MMHLRDWLKRFRRSRKKPAAHRPKCRLELESLEDRTLLSGAGTGLLGQYFTDETLSHQQTTRIDPTVNFNWTGTSPAAGVASTDFSVRWTGQLQANYTGQSVISTKSDDGVRVYLNGKLIINNWTIHSLTENDASVNLVAGQKYTIEIDYYQHTGGSVMQLFWHNATTPWQVIPTSQLYQPTTNTPAPASTPAPAPKPATPPPVSDWFSQNLHTASLVSLARQLDADGSLSRNDMLAIFKQVESAGALTSTELTDLRTIVSNATLLGMPGYVQNLAGKVVNGNPANADYLGQTLGNLAVGSSATQLTNLVNKWFLGTDLPTVDKSGLTYTSAAGTLFGSAGPVDTNVVQGEVADCYFVAAAADVAFNSPQSIKNDFIDNGDGTFTVEFFHNGTPDFVTVNRYLPTTSNGKLWYAGMGWSVSNTSNVLWVPLLEKAYAQLAEEGWSRTTAKNAYASLADGWEGNVMTQLTGKSMSFATLTSATTTLNAIVSAFQKGKMVCLDSDPVTASNVVPNHIYAVTGYNATTQTFTLYNPWGSTIQLTWSQIAANFDDFTTSV
jgi:hypothetical protein